MVARNVRTSLKLFAPDQAPTMSLIVGKRADECNLLRVLRERQGGYPR